MDLVAAITNRERNPNIPELRPGDRVKVHTRIIEGDRERIQVFQGTLMRMHKGGTNASFTVRRIASHGVGVERTFLLRSPRLEKVEVAGHTHVRRAQLYYLRGRRGKAARLREKRIVAPEQAPEAAATPAEE
jgi:large subunit ribosomal protein L19